MPRCGSDMSVTAFALQVAFVTTLYAIQGIPAGFIDNFLPLVLYERVASVAGVGLAGTLCFPWTLRFFIAPFVDAYGSRRFGKYKTWIVPMHLLMLVACALASQCSAAGDMDITYLCGAILLFTFATGVEDCAVDGYAMALLASCRRRGASRRALALLNSAQVVGFKLGHLYAGAPVWYVHREHGWDAVWMFLGAPILAACLIATFFVDEPRVDKEVENKVSAVAPCHVVESEQPGSSPPVAGGSAEVFVSPIDAARDVIHLVMTSKAMRTLLLFSVVYKVPEKVTMSMFKPYMVDAGVPIEQVGAWLGTYGTLGSTAGSVLSSVLVDCMSVGTAVQLVLLARCLLFAVGLVAPVGPVSILCQGVGSGIVTPAVFAYFMKAVAPLPHKVTSYSLLQSGDDWSRAVGYAAAGFAVEAFGYPVVFGVAVALLALPYVWVDVKEAGSHPKGA